LSAALRTNYDNQGAFQRPEVADLGTGKNSLAIQVKNGQKQS